jgi:hypothetical protein
VSVLGAKSTFDFAPTAWLELDLLGQSQGVIHLDAEIADGRLDFRVPKQQLDGPQVSRLAIELRDLGSPKRVCSEAAVIKSYVADPAMDDASVLPRPDVRLSAGSASKEVATAQRLDGDEAFDRLSVTSVISNCTGRPVLS